MDLIRTSAKKTRRVNYLDKIYRTIQVFLAGCVISHICSQKFFCIQFINLFLRIGHKHPYFCFTCAGEQIFVVILWRLS